MAKKKRKTLKLSTAERQRRRKQALKNFGKKRSSTPRKNIKKRGVSVMAKRKRTYRRRSGMFGGKQGKLIGQAIAVFTEGFADNIGNNFGIGADIVKVGLPLVIKPRDPMLKTILESWQLFGIKDLFSGGLGASLGSLGGNQTQGGSF